MTNPPPIIVPAGTEQNQATALAMFSCHVSGFMSYLNISAEKFAKDTHYENENDKLSDRA